MLDYFFYDTRSQSTASITFQCVLVLAVACGDLSQLMLPSTSRRFREPRAGPVGSTSAVQAARALHLLIRPTLALPAHPATRRNANLTGLHVSYATAASFKTPISPFLKLSFLDCTIARNQVWCSKPVALDGIGIAESGDAWVSLLFINPAL